MDYFATDELSILLYRVLNFRLAFRALLLKKSCSYLVSRMTFGVCEHPALMTASPFPVGQSYLLTSKNETRTMQKYAL